MSCIGGYIQEETEFAETLSVSVCVCAAEAVARTERLCGERLSRGRFVCFFECNK